LPIADFSIHLVESCSLALPGDISWSSVSIGNWQSAIGNGSIGNFGTQVLFKCELNAFFHLSLF
jgi:hypothetical protein